MADTPRLWLRPLVAGVTAVILGGTGAVVGAQFATPQIVESAPTTVTAPVVAPVAVGEDAVDADLDPSDETVTLSPAVAEHEVILPTSLGEASEAPSEVFAALAEADDPLAELVLFETESDDTGDACAPVSGAAPDGCPDGLSSTILRLVEPPELRVSGSARLPRPEGSPVVPLDATCPPLELDSGRVNLGIATTTPVSELTFRYYVTATGGSGAMTAGPVATSEEDRRLFDERLAAATSTYGLPYLAHCAELTGLADDTPYTVEVHATDVFGREADATIYFNTSGQAQRPGAQVLGVFDNYVLASALHPVGERAEIRGWIVPVDTAPSCEAPAGPERLGVVEQEETTVTAAYLNEINAPAGFGQKTSWWFRVPEGSTVFFCVRWFDVAGAASWERAEPVFQTEAILQSPDRNIPVLTIKRTRLFGEDAISAVYLDVATSEGVRCGSVALYQRSTGVSGPIEPCATDVLEGGQRWEPLDVYESSIGGDLVLTFTTELTNGRSAVETVIIPASDRACVGTCDLPPLSRYEFALPNLSTVSGGICGSGLFGSCPPRERTSIGGTVTAILEWERGRTNGVQVWGSPRPVHTDLSATPADVPQLDTDNRLTLQPYVFESLTNSAFFQLEVDRPVTYTARLIDPLSGEPCVRGDGILEVSGTAAPGAALRVDFTGLCFGTRYLAEVELVDDSGARSTWSTLNLATRWAASDITVPRLDVKITYVWEAESKPRSGVAGLQLALDGQDFGAVPLADTDEISTDGLPTTDSPCSVNGKFRSAGYVGLVELSENPTLTLDASIVHPDATWSETRCLALPYGPSTSSPQVTELQFQQLLDGFVFLEFREGDVHRVAIRAEEVWVPPTGGGIEPVTPVSP